MKLFYLKTQGIKLEVNLKDETVWLTQKQMAELFGKDRRTITRHIQNIYKNDAKEILKVIGGYSKALDLLDDYDHRTLKKIEGNIDDRKIEYQECINIINKLRFNEESSLFAVERDKGLESIIGNIYQSFARTGYLQKYRRKRSKFFIFNSKKSCICRWQ